LVSIIKPTPVKLPSENQIGGCLSFAEETSFVQRASGKLRYRSPEPTKRNRLDDTRARIGTFLATRRILTVAFERRRAVGCRFKRRS
jgi:hypothetical protein